MYQIINFFKYLPKYIKWFFQRRFRGFDDRDTWELDTTITKFILPRLERFKELTNGYPSDLTEEEWDLILDKIIMTFKLIEINKDNVCSCGSPLYITIKEGLNLFTKHYFELWW